jgi:hypothetical protein
LNRKAVLYDYFSAKTKILKKGKTIKVKLAPFRKDDLFAVQKTGDWTYWIISPLTPSGIALLGDVHQFVPTGKKRLNRLDSFPGGLRTEVLFAKGEETVGLLGYAKKMPEIVEQKGHAKLISFDQKSGLFRVKVSPNTRDPWQKSPRGDWIKTATLKIVAGR